MSISILPIAKIATGVHGRRMLFRLVLFLLGGILAAFALKMPARADESRTLIIPPNDGYGFEECLKPGSPCGLVVADAWCKAHGFAGSNGFGPADGGAGPREGARGAKTGLGSF